MVQASQMAAHQMVVSGHFDDSFPNTVPKRPHEISSTVGRGPRYGQLLRRGMLPAGRSLYQAEPGGAGQRAQAAAPPRNEALRWAAAPLAWGGVVLPIDPS